MNWHTKKTNAMAISESELRAMTNEMLEAHEETLPVLQRSIEELDLSSPASDESEATGFSRRAFLTRTGLLAVGGVALASSGAAASVLPRLTRSGSGTRAAVLRGSAVPVDVEIAALAASLENLAVSTYTAALSAASAGKLGTVPKAVATFVTTAKAQHADHLAAWNALVTKAGYQAITAPNAVLAKSVNAAFAKVTDIPGVAKLALTLEEAAAATYLEAIGVVSGAQAISTAATIHPVEMQHAAILHFVLGQYPVPVAFATTAGAATLGDAPTVKKR